MRRKRLAIAAIVAAIGMVIAACSSTGGSTAKAGGGGAAKKLIPFSVATSSHSIAYFPVDVAKKMHYFAKEGLSVGDVPALGGDSKVAAALSGGSVDAGGGVVTDFFNLHKAGLHSAIIASLVNAFYVDIMVGTNFHRPATNTLDAKIRALKGMKIGVPAPKGGGEAFLDYLFSRVGMTTKDVQLVNLGASSTGAVAALKTHRVDALDFFQPVSQEVVAQHAGSIYISPARGDIPQMKGQAHGAVLALTKDISKKPAAFKDFVRAISDAEKFMHNPQNSSKVKGLFESYAGIQDKATLNLVYKVMMTEMPSTPVMSKHGYQVAVNFHEKAGLISGTPPSYATASDNSFAAKALQSGG